MRARLFHFKKADSPPHTVCLLRALKWHMEATQSIPVSKYGETYWHWQHTERPGSFFEFCFSLRWRVDELSRFLYVYLRLYQLVQSFGSSAATHAPVNAAALATPVWFHTHSWILSELWRAEDRSGEQRLRWKSCQALTDASKRVDSVN